MTSSIEFPAAMAGGERPAVEASEVFPRRLANLKPLRFNLKFP
jgi:hypothetical protein